MTAPVDQVPDDVDQVTTGGELADRLHDECGPLPLLSGRFAIYGDGTETDKSPGGFVLVVDTDQFGTQRKHIPARLVKLAQKMGVMNIFGG